MTQGIGAAIEYHADSPGSGVVVEHVWPGSPAEAYGLESGDVILAVDRAPAQGVDNVKRSICGPEGTTVTLRILRNGEQVEIGPIQRGNWVTLSQVRHPTLLHMPCQPCQAVSHSHWPKH